MTRPYANPPRTGPRAAHGVPLRHTAERHDWHPQPLHRELAHLRKPLAVIAATILLLIGAGVLFRLALQAYYDHLTLTGLTADTRPVDLAIAGERLTIPANMLRYAAARGGGAIDHADLMLLWPTLEGYSEGRASDFGNSAPSAPLIYATIAGRTSSLDSSGRLDEVYARFFTGKPVPGPNGLVGRHLTADSGYEDEVVFYVPGDANPFVARCLADDGSGVPATCLRDIAFGERLSLLYRFDRQLLAEWPTLDKKMHGLAEGMLAR